MTAITGKVIAGIIGYLTLGFVGLLFGIAIGHAFDRGLWQALQAANPENLARMQKQFFATTFTPVSYTHLRAPRDLSTSRMPSSA